MEGTTLLGSTTLRLHWNHSVRYLLYVCKTIVW